MDRMEEARKALAREAGMVANCNGLGGSTWSCPFPSGTEEAKSWLEGWQFAEDFKTMKQLLNLR